MRILKIVFLILIPVFIAISCGYQDVSGVLVNKAYIACKDKGGVHVLHASYDGGSTMGNVDCMDGTNYSLWKYKSDATKWRE